MTQGQTLASINRQSKGQLKEFKVISKLFYSKNKDFLSLNNNNNKGKLRVGKFLLLRIFSGGAPGSFFPVPKIDQSPRRATTGMGPRRILIPVLI